MNKFTGIDGWFKKLYHLYKLWFKVRPGLTSKQEDTLFSAILDVDLSKVQETLYEFNDKAKRSLLSPRMDSKQQDKK